MNVVAQKMGPLPAGAGAKGMLLVKSECWMSDNRFNNKNRALTHTLYKYASSIPTAEISGPRYANPCQALAQ